MEYCSFTPNGTSGKRIAQYVQCVQCVGSNGQNGISRKKTKLRHRCIESSLSGASRHIPQLASPAIHCGNRTHPTGISSSTVIQPLLSFVEWKGEVGIPRHYSYTEGHIYVSVLDLDSLNSPRINSPRSLEQTISLTTATRIWRQASSWLRG